MTLAEAKAEIRNIILNAAEGSFYLDERQGIAAAVLVLRHHLRPHQLGHVRELENLIATFQSPHKAKQHGYQQVREWILAALDKIQGAADEMK